MAWSTYVVLVLTASAFALLNALGSTGGSTVPPTLSPGSSSSIYPAQIGFMLNLLGIRHTGDFLKKSVVAVTTQTARAPPQQLLVLGAGLSRTGTKSQKKALELLNYKVFHTEDLMLEQMSSLYAQALTSDDALDRFVKEITSRGYNATLDLPMAVLTPRLLKRFPSAKILLAIRDKADWTDSFQRICNQLVWLGHFPFSALFPFKWFFDIFEHYGDGFTIQPRPCDAKNNWLYRLPWLSSFCYSEVQFIGNITAQQFFDNHVDKIKALSVNPSQLLVFNVKEGWPKILKFLNRQDHPEFGKFPPPPFPRINEEHEIEMIGCIAHFVVVAWPILGTFFIFVVVALSALAANKIRGWWFVTSRFFFTPKNMGRAVVMYVFLLFKVFRFPQKKKKNITFKQIDWN